MKQKIHQGHNVKRFREMLGVKQETLALNLGNEWDRKKISLMEQKDLIEEVLLQKISKVLNIPVEAFQNFEEEHAVNVIANTFGDNACVGNPNSTFNFNPIEKWIEALEEIKKINDEKMSLYERMLREKDEMIVRLDKLIQDK
ncbi:XRE family transcriptional regulator [uncultured Chryseobacterium sp.]|uniref:XRE family transcriptional regulator n=1 Tax=uncultured Chryseobacterium sp. TaxID=259322 RepID=UPI0025F07BED|nr:XRE family transcriptional regulator [uncultured Chryseobacterium sp.]